MAIVGATQGLAAAFVFGTVVNAASAALFLYIKGHGATIFRDGLRLVLITFLLSSALWAQIDFISTLIDIQTTASSCQIGVTFATIFDQLGRFSIEQYLLWAMNARTAKVSAGQLIPQLLIWGRFVAGGVFVGFTKTQVDTFCVAVSSMMPVAIVVIVLDVVIILALAGRAFATGLIADIQQGKSDSARSKGVVLVMMGFTVWTATSIPLLLGMDSMELALRTALPAVGLSILILIVTAGFLTLPTPRGTMSMPPEAPSPRRINISRDISSADSDYPPSRYEDLKEAAIRSSTTFINPREAPRVRMDKSDEAGLPSIARPITGVAGMGGVAVQGALFPPTREDSPMGEQTRRVEIKQKKSLFGSDRGPAAAVSVGKLKIGNPILQDNEGQNPLNKIATMDLQEAARLEKERRAKTQRDSELIASRPAPQPPTMTAEEGLSRAISVKRKGVKSTISQPSESSTIGSSLAPQRSDSSSSGAQLSPGVEKLRQRSPRQPPQEPERSQSPQPLALADAPVPQETARPPIRPSRQLPDSPVSPIPEPTKTPLQRRPTNGLPSNPRSQGIKVAGEGGTQRQQTVLFVNNIIYDDPKIVQSILEGATQQAVKPTIPETPLTSGSIVHRPRPIPRKGSGDSQHQRTKSGGSISRKSILMSNPGSPTTLPPLPPPPMSAGNPVRPQPNDTRSMTFDEKVNLFFPRPPSSNGGGRKDSIIPDVPPLPAPYLDENSSEAASDYHRRSNRTTKTSLQTENILDVEELPQMDSEIPNDYSFGAYQNIADEIGGSWLPGIADDDNRSNGKHTTGGGKRGSSPVIPIRSSAWTETTAPDDATTAWGSVHSPQLAVAATRQVVKTADIKKNERPQAMTVSQGRKVPSIVEGRGSEVMTVMLDADVEDPEDQGPWAAGEESMADSQRASGSWHRRVGDECPSFSDRKEKVRSRKGPPPTPLLLRNKSASKTAMVIQAAEPSPLESPEQALQKIQEQLKKFEQPNRASVESQGERLALLQNLEKEMGDQESHWQEMKHDLGRDSMSSVQTNSPSRNSRGESMTGIITISRESSLRSNIGMERRASRLAKLRTSGVNKSNEDLSRNPVPSNPGGGAWQARLAEAQMEYMDNATELLKKRSMNFLSMKKDLGSPTPPDSEDSDEEVASTRVNMAAVGSGVKNMPQRASLWEATAREQPKHKSLMWEHTPARTNKAPEAPLPGISVRPAQRKEKTPLRVESTQLWRQPHSTVQGNNGGLWRPTWASAAPPAAPVRSAQAAPRQPPQPAPRPVTQRPPRRNKRVTMLPDIIENPEPMPDKRGTLGIFQFPWGEKSDTASVQARPSMYMAMPGTMTSGGPSVGSSLDARSRQLEQSEYSSSFFDDYDDENSDSDYGDGAESDDDGFDETTLWEIASLLKTDNVPSKNSLLPPPLASSVVDDYMNEVPSDNEDESSRQQSIMIGLAEEQEDVLFEQPASSRDSQLWNAEAEAVRPRVGLPHPGDKTWARYSSVTETARAKPRKAEAVAIESDNLWAPEATPEARTTQSSETPMWSGAQEKPSVTPRLAANSGEIKKARKNRKQAAMGLWDVPADPAAPEQDGGMFVADARRGDIRTTAQEPAAKAMDRKPRQSEIYQPLDKLESAGMWDKATSRRAITAEMSHGMWGPEMSSTSNEGADNNMFKVDRTRSVYRTTSKEPAAKAMDRKSRPAEQKPLGMLESTALWAVQAAAPSENDWMSRKALPAKAEVPLRRQYLRPVAYRADWEAALNEAIAASYPESAPLSRKAYTPAEWDAALDEAVALSGLKKPSRDAAVCHPVFFGPSLQTRSEWFHPAATGYTHDVAVVNPIFFGSLAITCAEQSVHPAMQGLDSGKQDRALEAEGSVPEMYAAQSSRAKSLIEAQIEALEQEKLFVAEAAKADYERRTSMATSLEALEQEQGRLVRDGQLPDGAYAQEQAYPEVPAVPQQYLYQSEVYYQPEVQQQQQQQYYYQPEQQYYFQPEPQEEPQAAAPEEFSSILELQRQMEAQARARVSTVWYDPVSAQTYVTEEPAPELQPLQEQQRQQMWTDSPVVHEEAVPIGVALTGPATELDQLHTTAQPSGVASSPVRESTLWNAPASQGGNGEAAPLWAPGSAAAQADAPTPLAEDAEAEARRAKNRKPQQATPAEDAASGSMWSSAEPTEGERDWLSASSPSKRTSGVQLRY